MGSHASELPIEEPLAPKRYFVLHNNMPKKRARDSNPHIIFEHGAPFGAFFMPAFVLA